jgi:molybdopterin molybdotransferase
MSGNYVSYNKALDRTLSYVKPLDIIDLPIDNSYGYIVAEEVFARVNTPSLDSSMKDGFAVRSVDVAKATPERPVHLKRVGVASAGHTQQNNLLPSTTIRILTGAGVPDGADAVIAEEFTDVSDHEIVVSLPVEKGRNILRKGSDIATGERILVKGDSLSSGRIGLLAAAGYDTISVFQKPRVAIIATGDEVVLPGKALKEGQLYASNLLTLHAWCRRYRLETHLEAVRDNGEDIKDCLSQAIGSFDVILTSGGAWTGDRDLVVRTLDALGWEKVFYRVRIGPGKAIGFGLLYNKPIFVLPGGPPSNLVAFLQFALPALLKMSGMTKPCLPSVPVTLASEVKGQKEWTQAVFGYLTKTDDRVFFEPRVEVRNFQKMAHAEGVLLIPEGVSLISKGEKVEVQQLV